MKTAYVQPTAPTDAFARQYENCVVLTWTPSPDAASYTLHRLKPNGVWTGIGTFSGISSYVDENFYDDSPNVYRIRANGRGTSGNSGWSNSIAATVCSETLGIDPSANVALATSSTTYAVGATPSGAIAFGTTGDSATVSQAPTSGALALNGATGAWSYSPTPRAAVNGVVPGNLDLFAVDVFDSEGNKLDGTCVVVESYDEPAPIAPVAQTTAVADSFSTVNTTTLGRAAAIELDLLANDRTPQGRTATIVSASLADPSSGVLTLASDGATARFVPANGYSGTVSISYQIEDDLGATSNSSATVAVVAPPSDMTSAALTYGSSVFATSELASYFSGSFSWTHTVSAVVDGVAYTTTISATSIERNGASRLLLSQSWSYQYSSNGVACSGTITSEYAYSSSSARESVRKELHSYETIVGGSGGSNVNWVGTSDYIATEQVVAGYYTSNVYQKKTESNQASSTSADTVARYGLAVPVVSHSFVSSFESAIAFLSESGQVGSTTVSGQSSTFGREKASLSVSGGGSNATTSRTVAGGLNDSRAGTTTSSYSSTSNSNLTYSSSASWNELGWGAWSGSGRSVGSGTET
ncbi:MAG: cadherin-like domain-containing protein, partial [Thermoguttaceae bacterium]|nr:cadherin-like domain-containing protein [Thermoguttaceae bacterium]